LRIQIHSQNATSLNRHCYRIRLDFSPTHVHEEPNFITNKSFAPHFLSFVCAGRFRYCLFAFYPCVLVLLLSSFLFAGHGWSIDAAKPVQSDRTVFTEYISLLFLLISDRRVLFYTKLGTHDICQVILRAARHTPCLHLHKNRPTAGPPVV